MRPRQRGRHILICSAAIAALAASAALAEDQPAGVYNNYGSSGLIDMPSARMAPDGQFWLGAAFTDDTERYNFGFQALPWLEANFRYTGLSHFNPDYPVYWDRSFALKARLWQEGAVLPAVAVGINDLVGTGIYSGEYIVASKRFGAVDATFGLGWGRMAGTATFQNPFAAIFPSFKTRRGYPYTTAGGTNFKIFFHGPAASVFGGLTWATPIDGLTLIGEYSSDNYKLETQRGTFKPANQFNLGASYQVSNSLNIGLNWLYGKFIGGNFVFKTDPTRDPFPQRIGPTPPAPHIRTHAQQQAALDALLARGRPARAPHYGDAEMIDALWRGEGLSDLTVHGRTLILTVTDGVSGAACARAARLVGQYSLDITAVRLTDGRQTQSCAVTPQPALAVLRAQAPDSFAAAIPATLTQMPDQVLTIDARPPAGTTQAAALAAIKAGAAKQQIVIQAISFGSGEITVYYSNIRYFSEEDALNRLTRVLMDTAPPDIEEFRLIATMGGVPQREFDVLRAPLERSVAQQNGLDLADNLTMIDAPMRNPALSAAAAGSYPRFSWNIFPQLRQELFDPNNPFGVQFLAGTSATVELLPGLSITGEAEASIWDDFSVNRAPDSALPHVRTDFLKYFTKGKDGIGNLEAAYRFRLAPNVFATLKAGYLESMFAGAGGEILWRPDGQRWALGADLYEVQKRNFDRLFGLMPYRAVTGHVSLYYASPWYGLNFELRAGQYLARDRGLTVQVTRRFASGVEIGAFFTKTNVSAQQFGEGSFDKGIILRIPLGWVAPINTQGQINLDIRPVQRDGGQALDGDATLYDETQRTSQAAFEDIAGGN